MTKSKIGTVEAIMLILSIVVTHTILSLPREVVVATKSAAIINLIFVSIIAIIISYFIVKMLKNFAGQDIIDISEFLGGKVFKTIIGTIFILYFLVTILLLILYLLFCYLLLHYV